MNDLYLLALAFIVAATLALAGCPPKPPIPPEPPRMGDMAPPTYRTCLPQVSFGFNDVCDLYTPEGFMCVRCSGDTQCLVKSDAVYCMGPACMPDAVCGWLYNGSKSGSTNKRKP